MKTLKNYKKLFSDFWGYHENDIPLCWNCHKEVAVDIHHLIPKGMGGVKNNRLNRIDNLYALCRKCHTLGHSDKELNEQWKKDLLERIEWKRKTQMVGEKLCKEVVSIVESRGLDYGDIKTNHEEIAKGWSVILGIEIKPYQVALCNDWQKTVRLKANPKHHDSYKDKMGYMITYSECIK